VATQFVNRAAEGAPRSAVLDISTKAGIADYLIKTAMQRLATSKGHGPTHDYDECP
jgi:hypothetical protein